MTRREASPAQLLLGSQPSGVRGPLDWPPSMAWVRELRAEAADPKTTPAKARQITAALAAKGLDR